MSYVPSLAARLRPPETPPAPMRITGFLRSGDVYCAQILAQAGVKILNSISPVCPPASPPCAIIISAPTAHALWTCCSIAVSRQSFQGEDQHTLGCPIIFAYKTPVACNFSTTHLGGHPTALTNNFAPPSIITSISSPKFPRV